MMFVRVTVWESDSFSQNPDGWIEVGVIIFYHGMEPPSSLEAVHYDHFETPVDKYGAIFY